MQTKYLSQMNHVATMTMSIAILILSLSKLSANDDALAATSAAPSTYSLQWLDRVEKLNKADVEQLLNSESGSNDLSKIKIDKTFSTFNRLNFCAEDSNGATKQEMLKLALTALPSPDVDQEEWKRRMSSLGDSWLPYINEMQEKDSQGFQMGIARMLCNGLASKQWSEKSKNDAILKLKEFLHSGKEYVVLGVLIGMEDSNATQLNDEVLFLLKGENDQLRQKAAHVLQKTGNRETADKMKTKLDEFLQGHETRPTADPSVLAIENSIDSLQSEDQP